MRVFIITLDIISIMELDRVIRVLGYIYTIYLMKGWYWDNHGSKS